MTRLAVVVLAFVGVGVVGWVLLRDAADGAAVQGHAAPSGEAAPPAQDDPDGPLWEEPDPQDPLGRRVAASLRAARGHMREGQRQHDQRWLLSYMDEGRYDAELGRHLEAEGRRLAEGRMGYFASQEGPRPQVPEALGTGRSRVMAAVLASLGEPEEAAVELLREFVAEPGVGYELTHQYLALFWFEDFGRELPADLREAKEDLAEEIRREHAEEPEFSDLFAERAMILSLLEGDCPSELAEWAETIAESQLDDGTWGKQQMDTEMFGDPIYAMSPGHTIVLSMGTLRAYIRCHHGEGRQVRTEEGAR